MNKRKHTALITGASSGIGAEFARLLSKSGYFVVLTGRRLDPMLRLSKELGENNCAVITADLSATKGCIDLYAKVKPYDIDVLINNAGFGLYGEFFETSLSRELEMIDVNVKAVHILFKLFLKDFIKKDRGYILNVASSAGLMPGPLMSTYYSTKSYVIRQTQAVYEELRRRKSHVNVSVLCPGPVLTDFNRTAGIESFFKGITARECAEYALRMMKKRRLIILPTLTVKLIAAAVKIAPSKLSARGAYLVACTKKAVEKGYTPEENDTIENNAKNDKQTGKTKFFRPLNNTENT